MTEDEAHRKAEALAQAMDITVYVVRNANGEFLPLHVVPDDCEIIATVIPPGGVRECWLEQRTELPSLRFETQGEQIPARSYFRRSSSPGPPIRRPPRNHPR